MNQISCAVSKKQIFTFWQTILIRTGNNSNKTGTTLRPLNGSDGLDRVIELYQNHLGMLKIKNNFGCNLNRFDFQKIKAPEVKPSWKNRR